MQVIHTSSLFFYLGKDNVFDTYDDFKKIPDSVLEEYGLHPFMTNSYWVKNNLPIATGVKIIGGKDAIKTVLSTIYDATDYLGEPIAEDLKIIKWQVPDTNRYFILLLPKIFFKGKDINGYQRVLFSFHLLTGEKEFFDTSEVWKNGA